MLVSGYKYKPMYASVGDALLGVEKSVKLLGLIIDSELTFNNCVKMIYKKVSQKLTAIVRLANIISEKKIFRVSIQLFPITLDVLQSET